MASTDLVTAARQELYIGDVESNRPNSEAINQKITGNINYILERLFFDEDFTIGGYFNNNSFDDGAAGIRYIEKDCYVSLYHLALQFTGVSGTNNFNVGVYDNTGAFVNNLFGSGGNALSISGNSGTRVLVGRRDVETVTPSNILINNAGHTVTTGVLNIGTPATGALLAGYMLVPFVNSNGARALNLHFKLRCKEL